LLFQLQASVLGIKEREFGLSDTIYPTPRASAAMTENIETIAKRNKYNSRLEEKIALQMYPTPTAGCVEGGEQSSRVEMTDNGGFILRKKNKPEMTFGAKLSDAMLYLEKQLYNTPTTNDAKNLTFPKSQTNRTSIVGNLIQQEQIKPGGKLNPNFVEFLMGYPMNWTKIDQAE
jgi:hypothetical protein